MPGFLIRTLISALGLWIASKLVSGLHFDGPGTLLLAALLLGVVNAVVRPLLVILTFPLTLLQVLIFGLRCISVIDRFEPLSPLHHLS